MRALRARGALIRIGHDASSLDLLPGGATAVITTHAAIPKTNPELVEARRRGIPVVLRPVVLAKLMAGRTTLMVTGTHGKTTTTSMLIVALQHCGRDPSFAVGGELGEAGTNAHHGSGDCFVAEADESDGSLLEYTPHIAVVTNIESDHLDFFGSPDAYTAVFDSFVERIAPGGALVVCTDDPGAAALAERTAALGIRVLRYALARRPGAAAGRNAVVLGTAGDRGGRARQAGRRNPSVGDAAVGAGPAHGAQCVGRAAGRDRDRRSRRLRARRTGRFRRRASPLRVDRHCGVGAGVRRLCPPPDRDQRHAGSGPDAAGTEQRRAVAGGVSAAFVFPDKGFRRRIRSRARRRRPGFRARRLRRTRTTPSPV